MRPKIGIVVIGRNEAQHLKQCLQSLISAQCPIVYADSASTDGSVEIAKNFAEVAVVELQTDIPLTAARGRNAGFDYLVKLLPDVEFVQFIDGDSVFLPGWIDTGVQFLEQRKDVAVVSGILTEQEHGTSVFKQLSALEWQLPTGEVKATGGNCLVRAQAFLQVHGFNPQIRGSDDNEFCFRIRQAGWKIWHLHVPMAVHDSITLTVSDFWRRAMTTGYGFGQVFWLHRHALEKIFLKENLSNIFYAGLVPLFAIVFSLGSHGLSLLLLLVYPLLFWRIYKSAKMRWSRKEAALYAASCVFAKFPEFFGACKFYFQK